MPDKDPDHEIGQFVYADGLWHRAIVGSLPARTTRGCAGGEMAKVVIIGGGVIGSSIAYYLALAGHAADVVILEPDPTYEFAASPRATGGIRQLFTVPENIRMAQYGHELYGNFEQLMAVDGDPAPIDLPPRTLSVAGAREMGRRFSDGELADPNRARRPDRIARPQGRQAPLSVDAGRRHRYRRFLARRRLYGPAQCVDGISPESHEPWHPLPQRTGQVGIVILRSPCVIVWTQRATDYRRSECGMLPK